MKNSQFKPIIIATVAILLVISAAIAIPLISSGSSQKTTPVQDDVREEPPVTLSPDELDDTMTQARTVPKGSTVYSGILRYIDLDACTLTLYTTNTGEDLDFTFTAGTSVKTAYDRIISAALLQPGDFVDVVTSDGTKLDSICGSKDMWSYKHILKLSIDPELHRIIAGSDYYRWDDRILVMCDDKFITLDELSPLDILSIYGYDNYVYLIKVNSGHGFLSLTNTSDYIGGNLFINDIPVAQITENLVWPLAVGDYSVRVENLELSGSADIRINSLETVSFDLAPYSRIPVECGTVSFSILPEGAQLFIDGVNTFYGDAFEVPVGSHAVRVELGGYTSFIGTINVTSEGNTYSISLPPAPTARASEDILYSYDEDSEDLLEDEDDDEYEEDDDDDFFEDSTSDEEDDEDDEEDDSDTSKDTNSPSGSSSEDEVMRISCTEGCAIYIDDVYAGEIKNGSLVCDKPAAGTVYIRLTLPGYITRTYNVTIEDDGEDADFSFPDMVKE